MLEKFAMSTNTKTMLPSGRLVIEYLQESTEGATLSDIVRHLQEKHGEEPSDELKRTVQSMLDHGAALGFLERKGSHFITWLARGMRCRRRRRRCGCRRRRRRSGCRRRRRRRRC